MAPDYGSWFLLIEKKVKRKETKAIIMIKKTDYEVSRLFFCFLLFCILCFLYLVLWRKFWRIQMLSHTLLVFIRLAWTEILLNYTIFKKSIRFFNCSFANDPEKLVSDTGSPLFTTTFGTGILITKWIIHSLHLILWSFLPQSLNESCGH